MLHLWAFRLAFLDLFASFVDEKSCLSRVFWDWCICTRGVKCALKFVAADSLELEVGMLGRGGKKISLQLRHRPAGLCVASSL